MSIPYKYIIVIILYFDLSIVLKISLSYITSKIEFQILNSTFLLLHSPTFYIKILTFKYIISSLHPFK